MALFEDYNRERFASILCRLPECLSNGPNQAANLSEEELLLNQKRKKKCAYRNLELFGTSDSTMGEGDSQTTMAI